jgi:dsRNA-specific ribonuclease
MELGRGTGSSKKQAETQAAMDALERRIWEGGDAAADI